jgi:hypothetical protein
MTQQAHHCPACGRAFQDILDYPRVRVLAVERLPVPETVDYLSAAAAERRLARRPRDASDPGTRPEDGINRTPEVARACDTPAVQGYLTHLAGLSGQAVSPRQLVPPFPASGYFARAHRIPDTELYLWLTDPEPPAADRGAAEVQVYADGPNMGSAGGPTLQLLGAVARLHYQGLLEA